MLERPELSDATILEALRVQYGMPCPAVTFLPLGHDSATSVYRAEALDGSVYFLKARGRGRFSARSLEIPNYLRNLGHPHLLAPIPTRTGDLLVNTGEHTLSLYPYVHGTVGADAGMTDQHWQDFGRLVGRVHACELPPKLQQLLPRECFVPQQWEVLSRLQAVVGQSELRNPWEREFAGFWRSQQQVIDMVVQRTEALGNRLRQAGGPMVLCHADMHVWNVLIDDARQLWLVDWDETMLALKERDLMFVVGGIGNRLDQRATECFLRAYGECVADPVALAYYRYAWAAQDMAANGEQVLLLDDLSADAKQRALASFIDLFAPGSIISLALGSDYPGCP